METFGDQREAGWVGNSAVVVDPFPFGDRSPRLLRFVGCFAIVATLGSLAASAGLAQPAPAPFENRGLSIVNGGVLRFDEGSLLLEGPRWGTRRLGASGSLSDDFSASATATATLLESDQALGAPRFVASVLPHHLSAIARPRRLSGAGCTWWEPSAPFVVVEDELVAAGECQEVTEHPEREPLFVRDLRGGRWRVLRWLAGVTDPAFAAEGALLAIGAHRSGGLMTVSILDLATAAVQASFETPVGQLAFASARRLVLEIPARVASVERRYPVTLRLYSSRGSYLGDLGAMTEPRISHMHIVAYENGVLSVRRVAGGPSRAVVGFNPPARTLEAFALRWPELVASETTSKPLLPSEVRCWSGSYGRSSEPFLRTFDLARIEPFNAPPTTVEVQPATPLTNCGAAPP